MDITFSIANQTITRKDQATVVAGSRGYLYAAFSFSEDWHGLIKTAQFKRDDIVMDMLLVNDRCTVPWELLAKQGIIQVTVFGGDLITVNQAAIPVQPTGMSQANTPALLPTANYYAQVVQALGVPGPQGPQGVPGPQGPQGDKGDDGSAVPIDDASTAGDRVLSAQYIKAQLSAIEDVALSRQLKYWNRPAAYKIKVAAGRFNMSWNNVNGRMWVFPAGTVLYSDGNTPISTSTADKPDVTIPAGGGYVWLVSAMWNGLYSLNANDTNTRITGSLSDLPPLTYTLSLYGCSLVTGALSDLPPLTNTLSLYACSLVTGALSDLPPLTNTLSLYNCSLVTGALSDLPPLTYYLLLSGCSKVTGALSDLPPLTNYINLSGCSLVTGAYTAVNGNSVPTTTILTVTGLSATDMDATLIAYAACTKTGGTFTATGKTRTTASDAAVLHLTTPTGSGGLGWTVTGLSVV